MEDFKRQLYDLTDANNIKTEELMKNHTTFRIGGPASFFVTPERKEEARAIVSLCKKHGMPFYIMGNGSNLLIGDKGFKGCILKIGKGMDEISFPGNGKVKAGAGVLLSKLAMEIAKQGLAGFSFAAGIPGSLGGGVTMNAGAYGNEIKDFLVEALVMDDEGRFRTFTREELKFGYRTSLIQETGFLVIEAVFQLEEGNTEEILQRIQELNQKRKEKQPLEFPSAGSAFKRPENHFAGGLIDEAGLRGLRAGGAAVSEKHCGFIVNTGGATAADVKELIAKIQEAVFLKSGVHLEPEIRMIGTF